MYLITLRNAEKAQLCYTKCLTEHDKDEYIRDMMVKGYDEVVGVSYIENYGTRQEKIISA